MKLARHVPFLLAILFGALAAIFAHACAPRGASWWMVTLFATACAVLAGSLAMRLYRWLLTDSPSPITRRDITCRCGLYSLRGVVVMDDAEYLRIKHMLCDGCGICRCNARNRAERMSSEPRATQTRPAGARATVNPSAVFEGGLA